MMFFGKPGIVNVRMVITEERILSNIEKIQKIINPASKKQIVELEEDSYFKDLIDSIKTYLNEYPKKKNFPLAVYKAAYKLVEFATNQFENNTKKIEELIRQREVNINLAIELKSLFSHVKEKEENWKEEIAKFEEYFSEDVIQTLNILGRAKSTESENYTNAVKLIEAKIGNLEKNLHIEIEMERIEDKSKALSYIGIEIADALKQIPAPIGYLEEEEQVVQKTETVVSTENIVAAKEENLANTINEEMKYIEETRVEVKDNIWTRIKNTKIMRSIGMIFKLRISIGVANALPEGRSSEQS